MRDILNFYLHCSGTKPSDDLGAGELYRQHRLVGYMDNVYHYVIRRNGDVEPARSIAKLGMHTPGNNKDALGICLIGGLSEDGSHAECNFTQEQWDAARSLIASLLQDFPKAKVTGHAHIIQPTKVRYTFDMKSWVNTHLNP